MQLHILVATMSGNAESVAQALQLACSDAFDPIHIHRMETVDASIFEQDAVFIICSSTYGMGGLKLDARLQDLGAQRIGDICRLDASSGDEPENEAIAWCETWLTQALATT